MIAAIHAETTKIRTLRSLLVFSAALVVLHVAMQAIQLSLYVDAVAGIDTSGMIEIFAGSRVPAVPEMTEQLVATMFTPVPFLPVAGALIAGSEYWSGQIGTSVVAVPSRGRLLAAKAAATTLFTLALCLVLALLTTGFMFVAVKDWNPGLLVSRNVLTGYLRVTLIAVCINLLALGITMLTRRGLFGILAMALLLGLTITQIVAALSPGVDALLPISAARNVLFYGSRGIVPPLTSGPWFAAIVLLGWCAVAVAASVLALQHRDSR